MSDNLVVFDKRMGSIVVFCGESNGRMEDVAAYRALILQLSTNCGSMSDPGSNCHAGEFLIEMLPWNF